MPNFDPRFDAFIEKSADFAKPILKHIRDVVHRAAPEIEETIKWGFPHFDYKGPVCQVGAFKQHCTFGFWKSAIMPDPHGLFKGDDNTAGQFGRITSIADLPPDEVLIEYVRNAITLNENGIKVSTAKPDKPKTELVIPDYVTARLEQHPEAKKNFDAFSYSCKKEYVEWFTDAKTEATRQKRMDTAIEWIAEGKTRHWKYK